jgi:outer membrane protein OmpA-like peptidoglycan-associated protein
MRVKKVLFPAFSVASIGLGVAFSYGCHGEMHLGDMPAASSVPTPPPPPAPSPAPSPVAAPTPPPPPRTVKLHGIPTKGSQIDIPGDIAFQVNSATINEKDPGTQNVLSAVLKIMQDHPEITTLRVEGHTDSDGGDAVTKPLSDKRAAAVVTWLTGKGIDGGRMHSIGFGASCPMVPNTTAANKAQNRRTEFRLEATNGQPLPDDQKDANGCSVHTAAAAPGAAATPPTPPTPATPAAAAAPKK